MLSKQAKPRQSMANVMLYVNFIRVRHRADESISNGFLEFFI